MSKSDRVNRMIIAVDADTCIGCGRCVNSCPTGALNLKDDIAWLGNEKLCDGFGSCIAVCPENALYIEERKAKPFDWSIMDKIDFEDFVEKLQKHYQPKAIREAD